MFGFGNFKTLAVAALMAMSAGAASAAPVTTYCPAIGASTIRNFSVTIEGPTAAGCVTSAPGNIDNTLNLALITPAILLDKTDDTDDGSGDDDGVFGVVLSATGAVSGSWSILLPTGYNLINAYLGLKSGEGGGDPDWALFSLPAGILAGTWGISDPTCVSNSPARPSGCNGYQELSHINLYGTLVAAEVPLPAAGFLLIGALGGLAALRRRRRAA